MTRQAGSDAATIAGLGEFGLIDRIHGRIRSPGTGVVTGIGDDTAVLDTGGSRLLLATVDMQVEGRHFIRGRTPPELVGRRVGAVNLSDIGSMGGAPRWALVSLALPADLPVSWVDGFYEGLDGILGEFGAAIVGGNLSGGDQITADLTLLGDVARDEVLVRSGAMPGDLVCVTGTLGRSAAGRAVLDAGLAGPEWDQAVGAHLSPVPRVQEGQTLAATRLVHSMIDVSDGLAGDLRHICEASGTGAVVDAGRLPIAPDTRAIAERLGLDVLALAVGGGEDFELLLTASPSSIDALASTLYRSTGTTLTVIGEMTNSRDEYRLVGERGHEMAGGGWDHFRAPSASEAERRQ
jgi:thiamine-monophosphate kinase